MNQPYWSWGSDVPECDAPSVTSRICKDLDEVNFVGQKFKNEVAMLHREKGELEERVLRLEKCTSHADARKTEDAGEESHKTEDAGKKSHKIEDTGEENHKIENDGVAESREESVRNEKEEVQYTPQYKLG
ncbi:hypothetical protein L3X38_026997 [Prunus dulcis]|uniref:Uncharacterized protein n=1 Tax=Prunus dulcis TaxID=3755 RepID=A0AAD4VPF1_PRUDU|nr:hypothetical protein L3X38_026997 [Prunus dulcis]